MDSIFNEALGTRAFTISIKEFKDIIGISFDDFLEVDTLNRIKKDKKLYKNQLTSFYPSA